MTSSPNSKKPASHKSSSPSGAQKVGKFLAHFQHTVDSAILWGSEKLDDYGNTAHKDDHQIVGVLKKGAKMVGETGKEFFATTAELNHPSSQESIKTEQK